MAKIVGLRGIDGIGDAVDAAAASAPPPDPTRPAMTLTGVLVLAGSMAAVAYIFWATLRTPRRRSGFQRNGRRRYRKRKRSA